MDKTFKGTYLSFKQRLKKQLSIPLLFLLLTILFPILKKENPYNNQLIILIVIVFFTLCFFAIRNAKHYVNEITINDEAITFICETYNEKWENKFELKNTNLNFKRKGSRFNPEYILKINSLDNSFEINEYNNWNYSVLIEIYKLVKSLKKEEIIWDEKYMLENVEKKI